MKCWYPFSLLVNNFRWNLYQCTKCSKLRVSCLFYHGTNLEHTRVVRFKFGVTGTFSWTCSSIIYRSILSYKYWNNNYTAIGSCSLYSGWFTMFDEDPLPHPPIQPNITPPTYTTEHYPTHLYNQRLPHPPIQPNITPPTYTTKHPTSKTMLPK